MAIKGGSKKDRLFTHFKTKLNIEEFAYDLKWNLNKVNKVLKSLEEKGDIDININKEIEIYYFPPVKNAKEYGEVLKRIRIVEYDNSEDELELLRLMYFKGSSV
jgi:hypothetical protein